jgi:DNA topoisomerase-1
VVNKFLTQHFTKYVDYDFTANLESDLDNIAANTKEWKPVLDSFWKDFNLKINEKENIDRAEITQESIDEDCPKCGKPLFSRLGRRGKFIGCSAYPECDYTRNISSDGNENKPKSIFLDLDSGQDVFLLNGPYGPYLQIGMPDEIDKKNKPKRISIPPNIPLTAVNEEIAKKLMSLPITIGEYPKTGKQMVANIGRFGPYISHDGKFKSIPKSDDIFNLSFERAVELVTELIEKNQPLRIILDNDDENKIEVLKGRWGHFLQRGKTKAPLSQKYDYETLSFAEADKLIKGKEEKEKNIKKKKKK